MWDVGSVRENDNLSQPVRSGNVGRPLAVSSVVNPRNNGVRLYCGSEK
jgi:hypothetical protein